MNNNKIKNFRRVKIGSYVLIATAIVIAIVVLVNVLVGLLPSNITKLSVSDLGIYDISENTKNIVKNVDDEVTIYVVAQSTELDNIVYEYAKKIADLNPKIKVEKVDPVLRPTFMSKYSDGTQIDSSLTNIVVVNPTKDGTGRFKVIPNGDIYYREYSDSEIYYYQMMGYNIDNPTYFNEEYCLAKALDYVTTDDLPKIYFTTGHSEGDLDATITELIEDENMKVESLSTLTSDIPEDADLIVMKNPTLDITEDEADKLLAYIEKGGKLFLTTGFNDSLKVPDMPNLKKIVNAFGMDFTDNLVLEGNSGSYYQAPYYILPQITENEFSAAVPSGSYMILPLAHEINISETLPEGVTVSNLFTTSVMGYTKSDVTETTSLAKTEEDVEAAYVIGAMGEKNDGTLIWVSSSDMLNSATAGQFSNITYFMSVITKLTGKTNNVTASARQLRLEALTVDEKTANLWGIVLIGIIPAAILTVGIVIYVRRKRR